MKCDQCEGIAVIHVALTDHRSYAESAHFCGAHSGQYFPVDHIPIRGTLSRRGEEVLVDLRMLVTYDKPNQAVLYLCEEGGGRRFHVVIGRCEAEAIVRGLQRQPSPRPLTYDSMGELITSLGGVLQDVAINRFDQATYFSSLRILQHGRLAEIDIRPSDAFNLAIRNDVPIYINTHILDEVALPQEPQQGPSLG